MLKENNRIIRNLLQSTDLVLTASSLVTAYAVRGHWYGGLGPLRPFSHYLFLLYIILPLWATLLLTNGVYNSIRTKSFVQMVVPILKTTLAGGIILMTVLYILKLEYVSRLFIMLFLAISGLLLTTLRAAIFMFTRYIRKRGYNFRTILIVGSGKRAEVFAGLIEKHREWGVKVLGFVDHDPQSNEKTRLNVVGIIEEFKYIVTTLQVDEVVFVVPIKWLDRIEEPVLICEKVGIKASVAADFYPHTIAKTSIEDIKGWPLLTFNPTARLEDTLVFKRAGDLILAFVLLAVTFPFFIASVIAIKFTSSGPVFFKQERCGLNGRRFNLLKFRTMVENADELKEKIAHLNGMSGPVFKARNDPRVTNVGRFLRRYSLDELPQLMNVLKGDMSIVGPRPPLPSEVEQYDTWQRRRLSVRPGITCFWQVNGRNNIDFEEWMKLDLEYIDNWSFTQDFKIILRTLPAILKGTGL